MFFYFDFFCYSLNYGAKIQNWENLTKYTFNLIKLNRQIAILVLSKKNNISSKRKLKIDQKTNVPKKNSYITTYVIEKVFIREKNICTVIFNLLLKNSVDLIPYIISKVLINSFTYCQVIYKRTGIGSKRSQVRLERIWQYVQIFIQMYELEYIIRNQTRYGTGTVARTWSNLYGLCCWFYGI